MIGTLSSEAIQDFLSYFGDFVGEFLFTYRGELIDDYRIRQQHEGERRFLATMAEYWPRNVAVRETWGCQLRDFPDFLLKGSMTRAWSASRQQSGICEIASSIHFLNFFNSHRIHKLRDKLGPVGVAITDQDGVVRLTWTTRGCL
jgi:hypothetical protein